MHSLIIRPSIDDLRGRDAKTYLPENCRVSTPVVNRTLIFQVRVDTTRTFQKNLCYCTADNFGGKSDRFFIFQTIHEKDLQGLTAKSSPPSVLLHAQRR